MDYRRDKRDKKRTKYHTTSAYLRNVGENSAREEHWLLWHDHDVAVQPPGIDVSDIDAVQRHATLRNVIEAL